MATQRYVYSQMNLSRLQTEVSKGIFDQMATTVLGFSEDDVIAMLTDEAMCTSNEKYSSV